MLRTVSNLTLAPAGSMRATKLAALTAWSDPSVATSTRIDVAMPGTSGAAAGSTGVITPRFGPGHSEAYPPLVPERQRDSTANRHGSAGPIGRCMGRVPFGPSEP